ncbi:multidrug transporter MatE [Vescimonas fastidiosa]|uniref:Multidrug export protein MepA n=1 Tax=Vescimonas fastidiosa TaxID=2714353 RepID=A0A810PXI6_9FIRM|nr:MATE family efflux transporter [Vescimonas fastidiosa]BCK78782.1 multidrug transporter MatE [Vescimonas fastidiosa]
MQKKQSLLKQFFHFSAATVASLMVFSLYSIVDGLFVARGVGEYAMTAVNLSVPFVNLLFSIAVIFAVGTSTIIAYLLGQKNAQSANKLFSQNLATLVVIGVTISVLVLAFTEPLARLLGAEEVTLEYTIHYLQGLAPFAVCFMISYNLEVLVKTDGRPRLALVTVCVGCVTNCVLDYLAIFHWGLGIWGAAAATGLSQLLTCIIYLTHFLGKHTTFHPVRFRMDWKIYRRLLPIGISDGLTELCNGLMIFLFNHTILRCIGTDGLVAYTIIAYANTLVINITMGVSQGSQPLISFQNGRGDGTAIGNLLRYGLRTMCGIAAVCFTVLFLAAPKLVAVYLPEAGAEMLTFATDAFRRYSLCYLPVGFNIYIAGFLTAMERPLPAVSISTGRGLILQGSILLLLAAVLGGSSIWFAPVISEVLCLGLSVFFLLRLRRTHPVFAKGKPA